MSTGVVDVHSVVDSTRAPQNNTRRSAGVDDAPVEIAMAKQTFFETQHIKRMHIPNTYDIERNNGAAGMQAGIADKSKRHEPVHREFEVKIFGETSMNATYFATTA